MSASAKARQKLCKIVASMLLGVLFDLNWQNASGVRGATGRRP